MKKCMRTYAGASYVIILCVDAYYYAHIEVALCCQADLSKRKSMRMLHASDHITMNCVLQGRCKQACKMFLFASRHGRLVDDVLSVCDGTRGLARL